MAPEIQTVVRATQAWLRSSWHIQVPFAWLEACVEWLQEEAGGAGRLSQQQINQQALDQWMLTDLRDLDHPVLPEGLAQAQKIGLSGTFCIQVDSLLDISQPAYGQLQKWKGTDCVNEEVSAVTQATQRPWEARPMRMLLMQVTDGVQSLEAMEYQSIPALSSALKPGVKLQLQGKMVCRLGVLLLGPANVKVLGGEVEDLVERNNQGRVLCRTLGLPEEQGQEGETPPAPQQANQEVEDLELDDAELMASLDQQEVERVPAYQVRDSGYGTHSETSTQSSRSSSVRSLVSTASFRSEASASSQINGPTQSHGGGSVQGRNHGNEQQGPDLFDPSPPDHHHQEDITDCNMADEDFDDLPLDELEDVMLQASADVPGQDNRSTSNTDRANKPQTGDTLSSSRSTAQKRDHRGRPRGADSDIDFMDDDLECFLVEEEAQKVQPAVPNQLPVQHGPSRDTLTLTSPPFTYLSLLDEVMSKPNPRPTEIRVKAFIVTLLGKLSSSSGLWSVCATISDGTGYLDVEMSDGVLTGLLGFSVAEKGALKRDPARKGELDAGMRRCQEELVDMCCVMTVVVQPAGRKAVVTKAEPVSEKVLGELEQRARDGRK